ncbi:phosphoglycerate dehydrogenase [Parasphaerochaeta coccoides]|uniref:Phosphoglycerate dehydrogenase n=1 Tax=Parasphaerochaeta coccoides (strain ATCC BAA-1237 / DSM 17374 / SPN1) TaxID=760011 RepID=F4GIA6_PARC1|nr:phosphoglycerate dehydrogenase [Parasphaerochaeta coccoides]AEC01265.1 Phosphoglycerate dehydrogenase [Parasphaerochaeta coccoides DSM 17374]
MSRKHTVFVTARSFGNADDQALTLLRDHGCNVMKLVATDTEPLTKQLEEKIGEADAIIAGLEPYTAELLAKATKLKVLSRYGVGYDAVDLEATRKQNIAVTITPGANSDSVADMAVSLMLSVARNIPIMDSTTRNGTPQRPSSVEMWRKTLGVIGTGRIGKGVIKRCLGFEMRVLCHDVYQDPELLTMKDVTYTDLETLISNSDFISIHTPLTPDTHNLFSSETFKKMKPRAILVNTARGGIIDERALYDALIAKQIGGAGLDVTSGDEPYEGLRHLPNCILTPHAGAATYEAGSKMSYLAAENVLAVLEGRECKNIVS